MPVDIVIYIACNKCLLILLFNIHACWPYYLYYLKVIVVSFIISITIYITVLLYCKNVRKTLRLEIVDAYTSILYHQSFLLNCY